MATRTMTIDGQVTVVGGGTAKSVGKGTVKISSDSGKSIYLPNSQVQIAISASGKTFLPEFRIHPLNAA